MENENTMITDPADFFAKGCGRCRRFNTVECSVKTWADGLADLRRICLDMGLTETAKWGHPCYMHAGRNLVIIGAFRRDFRLTFFKGALMQDPEKILQKHGPNSQHAEMISFQSSAKVAALEPIIRAYITEAKGYAAAGILPERIAQQLDWPDELTTALDDDPALAEAFNRLTPGRRKSYILNLNAAKKSETRISRIEGFRDKIFAGKGALDR